jgi:hypothetical protein
VSADNPRPTPQTNTPDHPVPAKHHHQQLHLVKLAPYLHSVPRVAAALTVRLVPVEHWASAVAFCSFVVAAGVAVVVFICARDVTADLAPGVAIGIRLALGLAVILVPASPHEVLGNLANIHWYLLWAMPWVLFYVPRTWWGASVLALVALSAATSEIQTVVFAPLILWRVRIPRTIPVKALYLAGLIAQAVTTIHAPRAQSDNPKIDLMSLVDGFFINGVMTIFLPREGVGGVLAATGPWIGVIFALPFVFAMWWVLRRRSDATANQRLFTAVLILSSVILYVTAVEVTPKAAYGYAGFTREYLEVAWISRYGIFPAVSFLAVSIIALTIPAKHGSHTQTRWALRACVGGVLLAVVLIHFVPRGPTLRAGEPDYPSQIADWRIRCDHLPPAERVPIEAAPTTLQDLPGRGTKPAVTYWELSLTCARVRGG